MYLCMGMSWRKEKHVYDMNDSCRVGGKEESFVEQWRQVGIKDDRRYHGIFNEVSKPDLFHPIQW
jgi:hypothetical protein